jgi:prevent-host-death family protein
MEEVVSSADANRRFSTLLRDVRKGRSFVVTGHGRPVARLVPAEVGEDARHGARAQLLERLERQAPTDSGRWTRDELYENDG